MFVYIFRPPFTFNPLCQLVLLLLDNPLDMFNISPKLPKQPFFCIFAYSYTLPPILGDPA